ncbi:hypothetical protein ACTZWT_23315 [Rhodopseudomonas sp. NSM]|uniref:hypothetical protein n=1 Tax=Rhodopseudomonas sp. NSM TaxID=3457630 RepID=UPI004036D7F1
MIEWLDLSGFGPILARLRRRLDRMPNRGFSQIGALRKLGRVALILVALGIVGAPIVWLLAR